MNKITNYTCELDYNKENVLINIRADIYTSM